VGMAVAVAAVAAGGGRDVKSTLFTRTNVYFFQCALDQRRPLQPSRCYEVLLTGALGGGG
jgi:hypothetical protein